MYLRYNKSTFYKPSFDEPDFVCSLPDDGGTSRCSDPNYQKDTKCRGSFENNSIFLNGSVCVNWNKYYNTCKQDGPNPFYNLTSFDNIGIAWIVIFQVNFWKDSECLKFSNILIYEIQSDLLLTPS